MFRALAYAEPVPAVEADRRLASIGRACLRQRALRLVEGPAHAAHAASSTRTLAALKIAVEIRLGNTVKLAKPYGRKLARPHKPVNELVGHAEHVGNLF